MTSYGNKFKGNLLKFQTIGKPYENTFIWHRSINSILSFLEMALQPEILGKLISELLLFLRFFLNFPRPYILIEWTNSFFLENFWATAMWQRKTGMQVWIFTFFFDWRKNERWKSRTWHPSIFFIFHSWIDFGARNSFRL